MEFLGDSILSLVVSEYLYEKNPNKNEGYLSRKRSEIVTRKNLNKIGEKIIPKTEIKHKLEFLSENIFGNILEAIIAAIYLDKGYEQSRVFIENKIIFNSTNSEIKDDFKSKILEWSQKKGKIIHFKTIQQKGPDHKKQYLIQLLIDKEIISESWGLSKKSAEQKVSEIAYKSVC